MSERDPVDLEKIKRDGMTVADVGTIAETFQGLRPLCRADYRSKCCLGPVDVFLGKIVWTTATDWAQPIVRVCVTCGHTCEGVKIEDPTP